ncbi:hypothetical protein [Stutzerimonas stutzeri]|uniref:hypothetical protein n=1 Tax=Stutzerimonas stutzeri TaxID=316 RepID=UPI001ED8D45D|nr:hypothetical protein [Stutzerimonas stutzeri]
MGANWMTAAARAFAQQSPPTQPQLISSLGQVDCRPLCRRRSKLSATLAVQGCVSSRSRRAVLRIHNGRFDGLYRLADQRLRRRDRRQRNHQPPRTVRSTEPTRAGRAPA